MKKKFMKRIIFYSLMLVLVLGTISYSLSFANDTDAELINEDDQLNYYLTIIYDATDQYYSSSSDTATIEIFSDYLIVEDVLPEGLIFDGFVSTESGTIGAVRRSDGVSCKGRVVDGVDGLKYDETTRMISFKVKGLQAGCSLTVGIKSKTPFLAETQERMDFYNTGLLKYSEYTLLSNTLHHYIGQGLSTVYSVVYQYEGIVPDNVPTPPTERKYTVDSTVDVFSDIQALGYKFSGWNSTDVEVTDGKFVMPSKKVVFTGTFEKLDTANVIYVIEGDAPRTYKAPKLKEEYVSTSVSVDSFAKGTVLSGYRFLGWTTDDVDITDGVFEMPDHDVIFTGAFELADYVLKYEFIGEGLPEAIRSLLPEDEIYYPNDLVYLKSGFEYAGYRFEGWSGKDAFVMPEEDVTVYGTWKKINGEFAPEVTAKILNEKEAFVTGDKVDIEITVKNTASYDIANIDLKGDNPKVYFVNSDTYDVVNNSYAKVDTLAANSEIKIYASYLVNGYDASHVSYTAELVNANADGDNYLDDDKDYSSTIEFKINNINLKIINLGEDNEVLEGASFGLYNDAELKELNQTGLEFLGLDSNRKYYLKEISQPDGYMISDEVLEVTVNEKGIIFVDGKELPYDGSNFEVTIINKKVIIIGEYSPKTLDLVVIYYIILAIGLLGVASTIIILKRKKI